LSGKQTNVLSAMLETFMAHQFNLSPEPRHAALSL